MPEYNLSFVRNDDAVHDYHFEANNDDEAKAVVRDYLGCGEVLVWRVARVLERFEHAP
ncbi:hypothetical protein ACFSCW_13145 [Sphingomonas tabacisoli]|uniref:Uncharacterized protein n=1 Tax=Sphingomonas tabacisoli TaxID=2249466 RepID=A0ABW4I5E8_9SPHN